MYYHQEQDLLQGLNTMFIVDQRLNQDDTSQLRDLEINQSTTINYSIPQVDKDIATDIVKCFQDNMENFTDFTVNIGDFQFNCHKFVLSSCSGFFEALMRTDMREKSESSCTIEGISPEIFGLIMDIIYKGRNVLNEANMLQIWHASNQLQIKLLTTASEKFVQSNITVINYKTILTNAEMLNSSTVIATIKEVLAKSFYDLVCLEDFMKISFEELLEILMSCQLNVCPDFRVHSVLKWTGTEDNSTYSTRQIVGDFKDNSCYNPTNFLQRRTCLSMLLKAVPLENTTTKCLSELMNNEYMLENKEAMRIVNGIAATRLDVYQQDKKKGNKMYAECKHCFQMRISPKHQKSWCLGSIHQLDLIFD
ncbi:kelch-like protein 40b [Physella acuta]|uniref:kelch-like protein 40b n=1 Tax=Physella acuta TaxID=109671 RepID=UPI0027DC8012|nr:kelch-like protein 40b [Physella acuta]